MEKGLKFEWAWRSTLFLGINHRSLAIVLDDVFCSIDGYVIGLGWLEIFIGITAKGPYDKDKFDIK